jgi:hypothetical protein
MLKLVLHAATARLLKFKQVPILLVLLISPYLKDDVILKLRVFPGVWFWFLIHSMHDIYTATKHKTSSTVLLCLQGMRKFL